MLKYNPLTYKKLINIPSVTLLSGTVLNYSTLPSPASSYPNQIWNVEEGSGGYLSAIGVYKYPKGLYSPNSSGVWELVPFNVKLSEDSLTLVNITDWTEFYNYQFDINAGDRLMYNEVDYINLTGTSTLTSPDLDTTNWSLLSLYVNSIRLDTNNVLDPIPGEINWNLNEGTANIGLPGGNSILQIGQEMSILCRNNTGTDIPNGTAVMFTGTIGNSGRITIAPMLADGTYLPGYVVGVTTETVLDGADGFVAWFGKIRGIDTTGIPYGEVWNDGDILYVSPTTAGYLTNIEPNAPNNHITVGAVINAHVNGIIVVRVSWVTKLTSLQDINGTPLTTNGQLLLWDNDNNYFDFADNINNYVQKLSTANLNSIVLDNLTGSIQVDTDNPTYAWKDLIGDVTPKTFAVGSPSLSNFIGNVRGFAYGSGDDGDIVFHVPHDYLLGSDMYFHPHWGHNGTAISGSFVITYYFAYANRTNNSPAEAFTSQKVLVHTINTGIDITNTPQYAHRVDEIQITSDGGSASTIDKNDIEVDGLVILHYDVTTIPTITGGSPNEPFIFTLDIHYQSTGVLGTKSKDPDYRT